MRTWSKNLACGAFCLISLACSAVYFIKNLACGAFFSWKIHFLIIWGCISFQVFYSVYQFTSSKNDLNTNTEWSQQHNLYKFGTVTFVITKVSNKRNPLSNQTSWDTNRTTPFQFQNNLLETTYINTCNIIVTNTRLISVLFRLHAVSSRLLLNLWHSNGPEPKVHFFLLESKSRLSPVSCPWWSPISSTHHIPPTVTCAQSLS